MGSMPALRIAGDLEASRVLQFWETTEQRLEGLTPMTRSIKERLSTSVPEIPQARLSLSNILARLSLVDSGRKVLQEFLPILADVRHEVLKSFEVSAFPSLKEARVPGVPQEFSQQQMLEACCSVPTSAFLYWFAGRLRSDCLEPLNEIRERIAERVQPQRIKLLTYNVAGLPFLAGGKIPRRYREIGLHLNASDFDVVALQEMWSKKTGELLSASQYPFVAKAENMHGVFGGNGLATLSRFPIVEVGVFEFSKRRSIERSVRKGALFTRLQVGNEFLDIVNVHAPSTTGFNPEARIAPIRRENLRELADYLARRKIPGIPQFVVGDLNTPGCGPEYESLVQLFGTDLYRHCHDSSARRYDGAGFETEEIYEGFTFDPRVNSLAKNPHGAPERLDYHFGDSALAEQRALSASRVFMEERVGGSPLSDHWGVATEILRLAS